MRRLAPWTMRRFASPLTLLLTVAATGCLVQTQNSVSGDSTAYAPVVSTGNASLDAVQAIFRQNCAACHAQFSTNTQADWINTGDVIPGNPSGSNLLQRIRGSNVGGPEDMPQSGGSLTQDQIQTIKSWISGMQVQ